MYAIGMNGMEWMEEKDPFRRLILERVAQECQKVKAQMIGGDTSGQA